jgi:hydrogenase maturation protease
MFDEGTARTLVLGVGNLILCDEGVGLRVVEKLVTHYDLPATVQVLDGGTLGMDLLYYLEGIENLLIIDAVEMDTEPGTLRRLEGDQVPSFLSLKMSPHQIGIPDMLFAAKFKGVFPENIVLWGVQPELLEVGLDLSPAVAGQVDTLLDRVIEQLKLWGEEPRLKTN